MFDFSHPWFAPLYRRVLIVAVCLGWALFEFATGAVFWGILFAGIGAVAGYNFFISPRR